MFNSSTDLVTWWNKPIIWFFAILLSPIGLVMWMLYAIPMFFKNREHFYEMNHWSIFTIGAQFGLTVSLFLFGPFFALFHKMKLATENKAFHSSEAGKKHKEIVNNFVRIYEELQAYTKHSKGLDTRISVVDDKSDKITRLHLIHETKLNVMVFIYWDIDRVSVGTRFYSKDNLNYGELRNKLFDEVYDSLKKL